MLNRPENIFTYLVAALLFLLAALLLYWGHVLPPFGYEAHFFEAVSLSLSDGNLLLPRLSDGTLLYHSPVLPFWISRLGHQLWPYSPLGFRLIHILLGLGGLWGFFTIARKYLDARAAFYSCCVLAASLPFCWQVLLATPDSIVALSICSALLGFYLYLKTRKATYFWLLYSSLAFGVLTKGLLPLLLAIICMVVYLMFKIKMDEHTLRKIRTGKGFLLILLLTAPWFIYAGLKTDGTWLEEFFGHYHIERYFGRPEEAEAPFYQPFLFILLLMLPFGAFLPAAFSYSWKYKVKKDLLFLSSLSLLVMLIFFAFSDTFYPHYLLPALPFASLLIGYRLSSLSGRNLLKLTGIAGLVLLFLFSFGLPVYFYLLLQREGGGLPPGLGSGLSYACLGIFPVGTLLCLYLWLRKKTDAGVCVLTLTSLLFNLLLMQLVPGIDSIWEQLKGLFL